MSVNGFINFSYYCNILDICYFFRYDSERDLFALADIDPDEIPDGWDIANETTSRFRTILDNENLLNRFLNEDLDEREIQNDDIKNNTFDGNDDPEASFLRISSNLRQALKKHLPWVILIFRKLKFYKL